VALPFFLVRWLVKAGLGRLWPAARRLAPGGASYLPYYANRVLAAPCAQLAELAPFTENVAADVIDLACGTPRFDLAPSMSTRLPPGLRGNPPAQGLLDLRQALAECLQARGRGAIDPHEQLLITPGVSGALSLVLDSFLDPGDRVVLFDPCSPLYTLMARQRRLRIRWLPTWLEAGRTRFHFEPLVKSLRGARLLIVNTPANPTGGIISADDLEQLAWWSNRHDVLLFSDDCFERFQYDSSFRPHLATFPKARERLLAAGSFTHGHGLAHARVGWLAGSKHLIRPCTLTATLQAALVPTLSQQLALAALQQGDEAFKPILENLQSRRQYACERLTHLGLEPEWPAGGFFVWLPAARGFAEALLRSKKVLVWPGEHFGPSGAGHARLSLAGDEGRLREGLARIADFLRTPSTARAA
jgi:aspartate/methionine/tyrosine aminotransferase